MEDTEDLPPLDAELRRAARTTIGDELRSLTYFTEDDQRQVYLRDDLESGANLEGFAEIERLGFRSKHDYGDSELGDYEFTIRVFEFGYLTRAIANDHGTFATTDEMTVERFSDAALALKGVLEENDPE